MVLYQLILQIVWLRCDLVNPVFRNGTPGINPILVSEKYIYLSLVFSKKAKRVGI